MQRTSSQNRPPAGSDAESYSLAYALNLLVQIYSAKCAVSIKAPHNNINAINEILPEYDDGGLLKTVKAKLRGSANETDFVTGISYNPKGQRTRIKYGNGATTKYEYDEKNFRLARLLTTRNNGTDTLQDLNYIYDQMGNITQIKDDAQKAVFHDNQQVNPTQTFEYDALYRLTKATGREHAQNDASTKDDGSDYPQSLIQNPAPCDASALRNYTREWEYDEVGNIMKMIHNANNSSWNRSYSYAATNNQLVSTKINDGTPASYTYNEHGSMAAMPHLQAMDWDFAERLCHITKGTTEAYYNYDGSGQRTRKVVEKNNGNTVETRLYLGGFEIYRKKINGTIDTERETLHIMDDTKRIALIDTLTIDNGTTVNNSVQRYQLSNNIESATLELDESASIISYEEYYPYGDTSYQAGKNIGEVSQKRYRYTGKEKDEESGLYYMLARYYSGWLGRWTASDPAGLVDGVNLYMYCRGNPVGLVDWNGRKAEDENNKKTLGSYLPGTSAGEQAFELYSDLVVAGASQGGVTGTLKQIAGYTGGFFSALWTPESAAGTVLTLGTAGVGALAQTGRLGAASIPVFKGMPLWGGYESSVAVTEGITGTTSGAHALNIAEWALSGEYQGGQEMSNFQRGLSIGLGGLGAIGSLGAGARLSTTKEGFLSRGFNIKAPFDIPVQRFGDVNPTVVKPWGLQVGPSLFINRTFVAITPEFNKSLTLYTTGVIPAGTPIKFGIIGPQSIRHLGGLLQFNVQSGKVANQITKEIIR
jgi:RHS repeat-associated protein